MKRHARLMSAACVATIAAGAGSGFAASAEGVAVQQDLVNVKTSSQIMSAVWRRQPDSYALQIAFDSSKRTARVRTPANPADTATAGAVNQPRIVNVADALQMLVPQNNAGYVPFTTVSQERSAYFISNTIANLRGLDPYPCGVTVMLADGKTPAPQQPVLPDGGRRAEMWLLKADGTYIPPATSTCDAQNRTSPNRTEISISYGYSVADGAQAVAVAIRIGDDFYIDKLQPLAATPAVQ